MAVGRRVARCGGRRDILSLRFCGSFAFVVGGGRERGRQREGDGVGELARDDLGLLDVSLVDQAAPSVHLRGIKRVRRLPEFS